MTAARVDLAISVAVAAFGAIVWWGTLRIDTGAGLLDGPRLLPTLVASGLMVLSAGLAVHAVGRLIARSSEGDGASAAEWRGFIRISAPLLALVFLYVVLLNGFGYLLATMLTAPMAFLLFGNRGWRQALILPVGLAVLFYVLFFHLLGMFDPPGAVFDLSVNF